MATRPWRRKLGCRHALICLRNDHWLQAVGQGSEPRSLEQGERLGLGIEQRSSRPRIGFGSEHGTHLVPISPTGPALDVRRNEPARKSHCKGGCVRARTSSVCSTHAPPREYGRSRGNGLSNHSSSPLGPAHNDSRRKQEIYCKSKSGTRTEGTWLPQIISRVPPSPDPRADLAPAQAYRNRRCPGPRPSHRTQGRGTLLQG